MPIEKYKNPGLTEGQYKPEKPTANSGMRYLNDSPADKKARAKAKIERKRDHDLEASVTVEFDGNLYAFREIDQIRFGLARTLGLPVDWKTLEVRDEAGEIVTPAEWVTLPEDDALSIAILVAKKRADIFKDADAEKGAL